jgi:hypothetical protein
MEAQRWTLREILRQRVLVREGVAGRVAPYVELPSLKGLKELLGEYVLEESLLRELLDN